MTILVKKFATEQMELADVSESLTRAVRQAVIDPMSLTLPERDALRYLAAELNVLLKEYGS